MDDADNIIIVRYADTSSLYELIFKRFPNDALYTENDMHKYKSMLLMTNPHKHKYCRVHCKVDYGATGDININMYRPVDVNHTQEEIWKGIISLNDIE